MIEIKPIDEKFLIANIESFVQLLANAIDTGGQVGFYAPANRDKVKAFWLVAAKKIKGQEVMLLAAYNDEILVGSVQLYLSELENAKHRAEVAKLMVDSNYRRSGIGMKLMQHLEAKARETNLKLLWLVTKINDHPKVLYDKLGYVPAGYIPYFVIDKEGCPVTNIYFYKIL